MFWCQLNHISGGPWWNCNSCSATSSRPVHKNLSCAVSVEFHVIVNILTAANYGDGQYITCRIMDKHAQNNMTLIVFVLWTNFYTPFKRNLRNWCQEAVSNTSRISHKDCAFLRLDVLVPIKFIDILKITSLVRFVQRPRTNAEDKGHFSCEPTWIDTIATWNQGRIVYEILWDLLCDLLSYAQQYRGIEDMPMWQGTGIFKPIPIFPWMFSYGCRQVLGTLVPFWYCNNQMPAGQ